MNSSPPGPQECIQQLTLFREFKLEEMQAFMELADIVSAPNGTTIVQQDEPGDCMYILITGKARVVHRRAERTVEVATLVAGDFFGELALIDDGPRSADVIAMEDCLLFKVPQIVLRALAGIHPSAAIKLFMAVAAKVVQRMRKTNLQYLDSLLSSATD